MHIPSFMMRKALALLLLMSCSMPLLHAQANDEAMADVVDRALARATSQALLLAQQLEPLEGQLPRTYEGRLKTVGYDWWVSGFFPGVLWMLYADNGDPRLLDYAEKLTERVEPAKHMTNTHDLGFMLYSSFGQGYRLTRNPHYLDVLSEGTRSLLTRWNKHIGAIKSWEPNERWQYPVIIDNMMNLEMLCFMSRQTHNPYYIKVADRHASTTLHHHFRKDFSSYHVVSYDTLTARPHAKHTSQGYSDESAWARGQAWGLYGYTMMYRETHKAKYLRQARRIATFLTQHERLPDDKVPYWDYDTPEIPNTPRDASAAAIMASALIELSQLDPHPSAATWLDVAMTQLRTLSSPRYLVEEGQMGGFILDHSVGGYPWHGEVDVPLTYADYYYVEALLRMKALLGKSARKRK